jgi:hypothetical protein
MKNAAGTLDKDSQAAANQESHGDDNATSLPALLKDHCKSSANAD